MTVFWLISHLSDHGHTIQFSQPPKQGDHIKTPIRNSSWPVPVPEPCLGIDCENATDPEQNCTRISLNNKSIQTRKFSAGESSPKLLNLLVSQQLQFLRNVLSVSYTTVDWLKLWSHNHFADSSLLCFDATEKSSLQNPMVLPDTTQHSTWYMFCLTCPAAKSEDLVHQPALVSWLAICLSDQNPGNYWPHWEPHLRLSQNIDCFSSTKENIPDGILHLIAVNPTSLQVWVNDTSMKGDPFNGFSKVNGMTLT